jgi:hypothetical protein
MAELIAALLEIYATIPPTKKWLIGVTAVIVVIILLSLVPKSLGL